MQNHSRYQQQNAIFCILNLFFQNFYSFKTAKIYSYFSQLLVLNNLPESNAVPFAQANIIRPIIPVPSFKSHVIEAANIDAD